MLLYIVRHGEPIYAPDILTELGEQQAQALVKRFEVHGLDRIYVSPLGRARMTGQPTADALGLEMQVREWMSESIAWDNFSGTWPDGYKGWHFQRPVSSTLGEDNDRLWKDWYTAECFKPTNAYEGMKFIGDGSDALLEELGYRREGDHYRILRPSEEKVAAFCHQGFGLHWLSHLLQIPPQKFASMFDVTHSSVSVVWFPNTPDGITRPQCLALSDVSHIFHAGLPMKYHNQFDV
ncbi:MAG: histidine phosphatase family protein [Clostridia bacterium]|nr:histidine phosphatase family protein [Clostridia bacterium]